MSYAERVTGMPSQAELRHQFCCLTRAMWLQARHSTIPVLNNAKHKKQLPLLSWLTEFRLLSYISCDSRVGWLMFGSQDLIMESSSFKFLTIMVDVVFNPT